MILLPVPMGDKGPINQQNIDYVRLGEFYAHTLQSDQSPGHLQSGSKSSQGCLLLVWALVHAIV